VSKAITGLQAVAVRIIPGQEYRHLAAGQPVRAICVAMCLETGQEQVVYQVPQDNGAGRCYIVSLSHWQRCFEPVVAEEPAPPEPEPLPEKVAGYKSEPWRHGV
jgi:hypothetical protein